MVVVNLNKKVNGSGMGGTLKGPREAMAPYLFGLLTFNYYVLRLSMLSVSQNMI